MTDQIVSFVLDTLAQMGVEITHMRVDLVPPVYCVSLKKNDLIQSVEETLKSTYGILWSLTYGKLSDENRQEVIDLRYKLVNQEG